MKQGEITWRIKGAVFEFDNDKDLDTWINDGAYVGFTFYLGNADDSEIIFGEVENEEIIVQLLEDEFYNYSILGNKVFVNATVSFKVEVSDNVDVKIFDDWVANCSGWSCGDVYLVNSYGVLTSWSGGDISLVLL